MAAATTWGVLLAWCYGAPLVHGVAVGLWAWGPAIVLAARWRVVPVDEPQLGAFVP
jgi:hypothetical protein